MSEEKFKLILSAPIDKNGRVIKLTVNVEDSILDIRYYPKFTLYLFGVLGIFAVSFVSLLFDPRFLIVCAIFFAVMLHNIFYERAFTFHINKKTGRINYHRSGILMTSYNKKKSEYNVSEIECLEIHRYVKAGFFWWWSRFRSYTFQIFLLFDKSQRLTLSPSNLDFNECQDVTVKIRNFLGYEIPIEALD